jgi:hypothetical protein
MNLNSRIPTSRTLSLSQFKRRYIIIPFFTEMLKTNVQSVYRLSIKRKLFAYYAIISSIVTVVATGCLSIPPVRSVELPIDKLCLLFNELADYLLRENAYELTI